MLSSGPYQNFGAVAVVLAGGQGSRLHELTALTCKPAVAFAGGRRIVDWRMSNLAHCGLDKVIVASQYKPHDLAAHLNRFWRAGFRDGTLAIRDGKHVTGRDSGYVGTADAVTQNLDELLGTHADTVLVVAADHVYTMDYQAMIDAHRASGRAVTVAVDRVPRMDARAFGVMAADKTGRVTAFDEKPADPKAMLGDPARALVSMGIYAFDLKWLAARLRADAQDPHSSHDFGHDVLPAAVEAGEVGIFDPATLMADFYWRDVGTLDALRTCCIAIATGDAPCTVPRYPNGKRADIGTQILPHGTVVLPGAQVSGRAKLRNAIVAPGAVIPPGLEVGFDTDADARFFRVTPGGTVLITPQMLAARARALGTVHRPHLPETAFAFGMILNDKYA